MEFKQAIQWLKEGKKVRRRCFNETESHLFLGSSQVYILWATGGVWQPDFLDIEATDWEIYEEIKKGAE